MQQKLHSTMASPHLFALNFDLNGCCNEYVFTGNARLNWMEDLIFLDEHWIWLNPKQGWMLNIILFLWPLFESSHKRSKWRIERHILDIIMQLFVKRMWERDDWLINHVLFVIRMSNPFDAHWCVIQHWYPLASMDKWYSEHLFWCRSGLIISERRVWGRKRSSKNLLALFSLGAD